MNGSLIPIRVDVTAKDKSLRVVDTLLLDPTVLPIPLDTTSAVRLEETLFQNAQFLANELLADAEVQGMGRTVRHFTGRLDLWKLEMVELLIDNLLPQLRAAVASRATASSLSKKNISVRMLIHGVRIHDNFLYDPAVATPLQVATVMGKDLKLPQEAVVALAIDIAEQAAGLNMEQDPTTAIDNEGAPVPLAQNVTAAWELESSVHITNVAHAVAFHR